MMQPSTLNNVLIHYNLETIEQLENYYWLHEHHRKIYCDHEMHLKGCWKSKIDNVMITSEVVYRRNSRIGVVVHIAGVVRGCMYVSGSAGPCKRLEKT